MAKPWDVTSDDIAQWSQRHDAPAVLPDLVRRLLLATSPLSSLSMSAHAGTRLRGWDGLARSSTATTFCPGGASVWEMTVEDAPRKLNKDFEKRKADALEVDPRTATYVAVSARRAASKARWISDRRAERAFHDVWLLDAEDLAAWLVTAPAVSRWFASHLGRPAADAEDLEGFFSAWSSRTQPALPIEIALAGEQRQRSAESVRAWARRASRQSTPLRIHGETVEEAAVFAAAALASDGSPEGEQIRARTIVVTSQEALQSVMRAQQAQPVTVLAAFPDASAAMGPVLLPMDGPLPDRSHLVSAVNIVRLAPVPYRRFAEILAEAGMPRERADRAAGASGGSLGALQRALGHVELPPWAKSFDRIALSALLLAGAFEPNNAEDRDVLEVLGVPRGEAEHLCELLRVAPGSPMVREEGRGYRPVWSWRARPDAWNALVGQIPADALRRFEEAVRLVLGERDPALDLPPEQRFAAALYGKTLRASSALREGLADSLARIAWRDEALATLHGPGRGSGLALLAVRELLAPPWSVWASLSDLLPVLAEASPSTFLDCVDASLREGDRGVAHLLDLETGMGGSPHTGLLWALEKIGWDERLMPRVASALAKLAEHDAELERKAAQEQKRQDRIVNRPAASLAGLLSIALPQTRAPFEQRIGEVERRLLKTPEIGLQLLVEQLDLWGSGGMPFSAQRPQHWPLKLPGDEPEVRAQAELSDVAVAYMRLLLNHLGADAERWAFLLVRPVVLHPAVENFVLERLEDERPRIHDDQARLWAALRRVLGWLSRSEASTTSERWKRLYAELTPADPVLRYSWLFAAWPDLADPEAEDSPVVPQEKTNRLRRDAVEKIGERADRLQIWEAIAERNPETGWLGWMLGQSSYAAELDFELLEKRPPQSLLQPLPYYVQSRTSTMGVDWALDRLRDMLAQGRRADVGAVLLRLPTTPATWDAVAKLGDEVEIEYWRNLTYVYENHSTADWERAIRSLIAAGNIIGALRGVARAGDTLPVELVAEVLGASLSNSDALGRLAQDRWGPYELERLAARLEREPDAAARYGSLLANAELVLALRARGRVASTRHLSAAFAEDPGSFVELVTQIFRRSGEPPAELGPEEREQAAAKAQSAYWVLESWKGHPGEGLPPAERESVLHDWCLIALRMLVAAGRPDTGASQVARVLSRAPRAEDGIWPCAAARRLLESDELPSLASALETAKRNLRGTTGRSLGEGGKQERALASGFREDATKLRASWPRTADMLDSLATHYEAEAAREDGEAAITLRQEGAEPHDFGEPPSRRAPSPKRRALRPGLVHLEKITLTDFTLFERIEIDLKPPADRGQWVLLLGANGKGKTTVLRAMALALCGESVAQAALGQLGTPLIREGQTLARCVVTSAGESLAVQITNDGTGEVAACEPANGARPRVFGYGCRRGSALGGNDAIDVESLFSDVATLFSGSARLRPAPGWFKDLKLRALQDPRHEHVFDLVVRRLCESASPASTDAPAALLPDVQRFDVVDNQVWAIAPKLGGRVPLAGLSDGYLTTLGWVVDLVAKWLQWAERVGASTEGDFLARMEGLALVDEIDLHLHPSWQRTIVTTLKRMFPRLSFVVTTHNPITLLGTEPGEIIVLRETADGGNRIEARQIDLPAGIHPDRILTGEWFGLPYAVDDATIELIERHQRMLLEGVSLEAPERRELEEELARRYGSYADTSIDRMALEVAAELVRERRPKTFEERAELQARLKERLRQRVAERDRQSSSKS